MYVALKKVDFIFPQNTYLYTLTRYKCIRLKKFIFFLVFSIPARSLRNVNLVSVFGRQKIHSSSHPTVLIQNDFSRNKTHANNSSIIIQCEEKIPLLTQ